MLLRIFCGVEIIVAKKQCPHGIHNDFNSNKGFKINVFIYLLYLTPDYF